jgi:FixJ family two-component response regulator
MCRSSGSGPPEEAFRGYAAGAVDYLAKPFDPWVLKSKVSVFVDLYLRSARRDQAEGKAGRRLADQLSGPLAAVQETVEVLRGLPAVAGDVDAEQVTAGLARRVGRLREAIDALAAHPADAIGQVSSAEPVDEGQG